MRTKIREKFHIRVIPSIILCKLALFITFNKVYMDDMKREFKKRMLSTRGLITTSYFGRAAIASSITVDRAKESCKMVLEANSREVHNGNGEYVENDSSRMRNTILRGGS